MEKQSEHSLSEGFFNALRFPFKPGVLIYNLIALLLFGLVIIGIDNWVSSMRITPPSVEEIADSNSTLSDKQTEQLEKMLDTFRAQGASDVDIEELRKRLELPFKLQSNPNLSHSPTLISSPYPPSWLILTLLLISFLITTKNFDITAQIADGDFEAPTLKLCQYVSPFISVKFMIGTFIFSFLLGIASTLLILLFSFIPYLGAIFLLLFWLLIACLYPASVLSTIRTNSLWGAVNPSLWKATINNYIGGKNYLILLGFMLAILILSMLMNMLFSATIDNSNSLFPLLLIGLMMYVGFHLASANHYLMGFMTQHETPDFAKADFSGYEKKTIANKQQHSVINDARKCIQNGYDDDAIGLLEIAINNTENVDDAITAHELLLQIYEKKNNHDKISETRRQLIAFVNHHAPSQANRIMPMRLALAKSGEMPPAADDVKYLANFAFSQHDYSGVLKVIGLFAKQYPNHPDIVANYLLVGRALSANKQYEKAYQIIGGLLKKYPDNPLALELKSELSLIKRKLG